MKNPPVDPAAGGDVMKWSGVMPTEIVAADPSARASRAPSFVIEMTLP
jgi:hypothetical protein